VPSFEQRQFADARAIRDKPTGMIFPVQVQSWTRAEVMTFTPPLGFSVAYFHPAQITATLYVYDFGQRHIPDGPSSPMIQEHFLEALRDIRVLAERGKSTANGQLRMGLPDGVDGVHEVAMFRWASIELTGPRGKTGAAIGITGFRNHFLKVRLGYQASQSALLQEAVAELIRKVMHTPAAKGAAHPAR
jgi:hypothetical protein